MFQICLGILYMESPIPFLLVSLSIAVRLPTPVDEMYFSADRSSIRVVGGFMTESDSSTKVRNSLDESVSRSPASISTSPVGLMLSARARESREAFILGELAQIGRAHV